MDAKSWKQVDATLAKLVDDQLAKLVKKTPTLRATSVTMRRQINDCGPGVILEVDGKQVAAATSAAWKKLATEIEAAVEHEATYSSAYPDELVEIDGDLLSFARFSAALDAILESIGKGKTALPVAKGCNLELVDEEGVEIDRAKLRAALKKVSPKKLDAHWKNLAAIVKAATKQPARPASVSVRAQWSKSMKRWELASKVAGKLEGMRTLWTASGQLEIEGEFSKGVLMKQRHYHPDGTVWHESDEETGYARVCRSASKTNQSWFPSNDVRHWSATRNGPNETWKMFDRDGKPCN